MIITSENDPDYLLIRSVASLQDENDLVEHAILVFNENKKYESKKIYWTDWPRSFLQTSYFITTWFSFIGKNSHPGAREIKLACIFSSEYTRIGKLWETVSDNRALHTVPLSRFAKRRNG